MPFGTITSTENTFGTVNGAVSGSVEGTLTGSVGVPGPAGAPGVGVPAGGTSGQFLQKTSDVSYETDWVTVNLTGLATESWVTAGFYPLTGNPSGFLTSAPVTSVAGKVGVVTLDNTDISGLGTLAVVNDAPSDGSQYARKNGAWDVVTTAPDFISSVSSPLAVATGNLTVDLSAYAPLASPAFTGTPTAPTPSPGTDSTQIATTAWVKNFDYAPTNSPTLTGNPKSVTPNLADNDTSIATTAFVKGQNYLTSSALSGYALLSGATFSGKVNFTSVGGAAGLNIGIGGLDVDSDTAGDLWISPSGSALKYRDGLGGLRILAARNLSNTFSAPQIVQTPVGTTGAALRVTQLGTGNALVVEDSTTPDSTAFVIDQHGKVGIGVAPDASAALKVDTNGIMFGDGTTQTTAATGGGGGTDYQAFTTSGTHTWTKPAGAKWVEVLMFGGGGGGGSGARQATTVARSGGGGGTGGGYALLRLPASSLSGTQDVVVGAGGAGGSSVTANSTNGSNGVVGGASSFFGYQAVGGGQGGAGTTTTGPSGTGRPGFNNGQSAQSTGTSGGQGTTTTGNNGTALASTSLTFGVTGSGGGAGANANVTTAAAGGNGGNKNANTTVSGINSSIAGGSGGTTAGASPTGGVSFTQSGIGSTGSGGGAYRSGQDGMAGANGATCGGGGGGGSASDNGFPSGAGGAGGDGAVFIITYC